MNRRGNTLDHYAGNGPLVNALVAADVDFVVIGGVAISWHCKERLADDLDLLVCPSPENSRRIAQVLGNLGYANISVTSFEKNGLQIPLKKVFYAELLTPISGGPTFESVFVDAEFGQLFGCRVRIASRVCLRLMKEQVISLTKGKISKHVDDLWLLNAIV